MIKHQFDEKYLDRMIDNINKLDTTVLNLDYEVKK